MKILSFKITVVLLIGCCFPSSKQEPKVALTISNEVEINPGSEKQAKSDTLVAFIMGSDLRLNFTCTSDYVMYRKFRNSVKNKFKLGSGGYMYYGKGDSLKILMSSQRDEYQMVYEVLSYVSDLKLFINSEKYYFTFDNCEDPDKALCVYVGQNFLEVINKIEKVLGKEFGPFVKAKLESGIVIDGIDIYMDNTGDLSDISSNLIIGSDSSGLIRVIQYDCQCTGW